MISMDEQITRLVDKTWKNYLETPASTRLMIAVSGIPGSGKTTFASQVVKRINALAHPNGPDRVSPVAVFIPMDGYHLSRAELSVLPDPAEAFARRGAAFTFNDKAFFKLVQLLRAPLEKGTAVVFAPSFDHALKDPVENGIVIPPTARVLIFEGNYLSLNKGLWKEAAGLMDELWFVEVDFQTARKRLIARHVLTGVTKDEEEANRRITENDLVNAQEIINDRLQAQETIYSG